jgi:hypothetical protein
MQLTPRKAVRRFRGMRPTPREMYRPPFEMDRFPRGLLQGEVEVGLPIASRWRLDLTGSLAREDFDNSESNLFSPSGRPREDKSWGAEAALSFELTRSLQILVRGSFDRRDSSLDLGEGLPDLDYRRTTFSTGLNWSF